MTYRIETPILLARYNHSEHHPTTKVVCNLPQLDTFFDQGGGKVIEINTGEAENNNLPDWAEDDADGERSTAHLDAQATAASILTMLQRRDSKLAVQLFGVWCRITAAWQFCSVCLP
jgi:hypothetical protein